MTFSIVTPSLNHAAHIDATIQSVRSQNYDDLEYLVVDGGSTDGTLNILAAYNPRLHWMSEPDKGQAEAINKGFAVTRGDILGWLNSDNLYTPNALATVADYFREHPETMVLYGNAEFINADGKPIGPCVQVEPFSRRRLLHYSDYLVQPAVFFRREIFQDVGGLDISLHWAMDYNLWLKFAERAKFDYLPKVLAQYRLLPKGKTMASGWDRLEEVQTVAKRHGKRGLPAYFRLEAARLHWTQRHYLAAMKTLLASPRAVASLFRSQTWRVIEASQNSRRAASLVDSTSR